MSAKRKIICTAEKFVVPLHAETKKTGSMTKNIPYNPKSAESIWQYSAGLLGHTLREFAPVDYIKKGGGKGSLGQMVEELYFLMENNSRPEADFAEAGMELKCTPLKKGNKEQLLIKERLVCNMINYMEVVNEDFEHSHFSLRRRSFNPPKPA